MARTRHSQYSSWLSGAAETDKLLSAVTPATATVWTLSAQPSTGSNTDTPFDFASVASFAAVTELFAICSVPIPPVAMPPEAFVMPLVLPPLAPSSCMIKVIAGIDIAVAGIAFAQTSTYPSKQYAIGQ